MNAPCPRGKAYQKRSCTYPNSTEEIKTSNICLNKPRIHPLLGSEDPISMKQRRAFTIQAEQGIWDIGRPLPSVIVKPLERSRFQTNYMNRVYPFHIDYSGLSDRKIAWHDDIDQCPIVDLMRDTVEAQIDNEYWSQLGFLVFKDILKHVPPAKLAKALPAFSQEFKNTMRRNNEETCRRLLKMLKELTLVATSLGPELSCHAFNLFTHSQRWMQFTKFDVGDRIAYEHRRRPQMSDLYDELHDIFEVISGSERDRTITEMKRANSVYMMPAKSTESK